MYVFYASSNKYVPFLGVSIQSLFETNADLQTLEIFLCGDHISEENQRRLKRLAEEYGRKITFLDYSKLEEVAQQLKWRSQGGSFSTYSKLIMDRYLPQYANRVLYIDSSDTLVTGSLKPLETLDMTGKAFAARVATAFYFKGETTSYDHSIARRKTYYNCGVFLVDINNWKQMHCFDIIQKNSLEDPHFDIYDQTIINSYLPDNYGMTLPLKYNFDGFVCPSYLAIRRLSLGNFYTREEILDASKKPIIIHWPGALHHPYVKGGLCRRKKEYMSYLSKSQWKDDYEGKTIKEVMPKGETLKYMIIPFLEFYLPRTFVCLYHITSAIKKITRKGGKK